MYKTCDGMMSGVVVAAVVPAVVVTFEAVELTLEETSPVAFSWSLSLQVGPRHPARHAHSPEVRLHL